MCLVISESEIKELKMFLAERMLPYKTFQA